MAFARPGTDPEDIQIQRLRSDVYFFKVIPKQFTKKISDDFENVQVLRDINRLKTILRIDASGSEYVVKILGVGCLGVDFSGVGTVSNSASV